MKTWIINLLFKMLGNSNTEIYNIGYLFGSNTSGHESRKRRWEKALARAWNDKDFMDYLFYQAESDKEKIFQGKIRADLSRGARIRTLFFAFSARRAHEASLRTKRSTATEKAEADADSRKTDRIYRELVDVG